MGNRMRKVIQSAFAILFFLTIIFLFVARCSLRVDVFDARQTDKVRRLVNYNHTWVADETLPQKGKDVFMMKENSIKSFGTSLVFYVLYEEVYVYINDQLVYSLEYDSSNIFGKTAGRNWVCIPLIAADRSKQIRIELVPDYESSVGIKPTFYIGTPKEIYFMIVKKDVFAIMISFAAIIIGTGFVVWLKLNYANIQGDDRSLAYLGLFSVFIGIWKLFDLQVTAMFFSGDISKSFVSVIMLSFISIPFSMFMRSTFTSSNEKVYHIFCIVCLGYGYTMLGLQILNIADYRQMLIGIHILFLILMVIGIVGINKEIREKGFTRKIRITIICILICFVGLIIDMFAFYLFQGTINSCYGIVGFLIYILILGLSDVKESRKLMAEGRKAQRYHELAFLDPLTLVNSRSAFRDYVEDKDFNPKFYTVVMFDLNNLKLCNDNFGHEKGDNYLKTGANIIKTSFGEIAEIYRMGGDEFCALVFDQPVAECSRMLHKLRRLEEEYIKNNPNEFPVSIACGFARFDSALDADIHETMRRADGLMYENKLKLKAELKNRLK